MIQDNRNNFETQNKKGLEGEDAVVELLISKGHTLLERSTGYAPDYDARLRNPQGVEYTIEIKTDSSTYKNVAVEYKCRDKPSGIYSTKADYFAVYFPAEKTIYLADTSDLRLYLAENPVTKKMNQQNDSATYLFLIPKQEFTKNFTTLRLNESTIEYSVVSKSDDPRRTGRQG